MRFLLRQADGLGVGAGSHCFEHVMRTRLDPESSFDFVHDLACEGRWFPGFLAGEWETPPPHGVGSERWLRTKALWIRERFVVWDRGQRLSFVGTETTLPLVVRFAEDYCFTPLVNGGCELSWTISYTPRPLLRPLHPVLRPYFASLFRTAARGLVRALDREAAGKDKAEVVG